MNKGSFTFDKLIELTSYNSSKIFKVKNRGELKEGFFADITIVDMKKEWEVEASKFYTKAKYSPYEGMTGKGDIVMTFVNGKLKFNNSNTNK